MPTLAAIDVGSNAMRIAVGIINGERRMESVENIREPVRLGRDVFNRGAISEETTGRAIEAFQRFRKIIDTHKAKFTRAVATSALREAHNRDLFIDRMAQASGIEIQVIGPEEEARLIHLAVTTSVNIKNKLAMLIDIGGGSVEISLATQGQILVTESFNMGTVRLLQKLDEGKRGEPHFNALVREYVDATKERLRNRLGNEKIDLCIGTGGNIETLGSLRLEVLGKDRDTVLTGRELDALVKTLQGLTYEERIQKLRLRPDRADVIIPASIVLQKVIKEAGVDQLLIPHVGLKDGLLLDMVRDMYDGRKPLHRDQVLASARRLGKKYAFDEQHGATVARFAMRLFDETRSLHNLDDESRLLLEVAAWLHDVGQYVNIMGHHKHSYYLLNASPLIGLNEAQRAIVANVARYHRKSFPNLKHDPYRTLPVKDRVTVSKLAALLRLADALDNEHAGKVSDFSFEYKKRRFVMKLIGEEDLLLEKWSLAKKADLFQNVFSVKFTIED